MKVTQQPTKPPFTERNFTVEMTGLELATIKLMAGSISGSMGGTIRQITDKIYYGIPANMSDNNTLSAAQIIAYPTINISDNPKQLETFIEWVNRLNK
jgi:hypothetical protein